MQSTAHGPNLSRLRHHSGPLSRISTQSPYTSFIDVAEDAYLKIWLKGSEIFLNISRRRKIAHPLHKWIPRIWGVGEKWVTHSDLECVQQHQQKYQHRMFRNYCPREGSRPLCQNWSRPENWISLGKVHKLKLIPP